MHTKPDSERGKLLSNYVLARVTKLDGIDLSNYDFDRHNTLFYFVTNQHGHVYLRYGGRSSDNAEKFLNLESLSMALAKGLELFSSSSEQGSKKRALIKMTPSDMPSMKAEVITKQRCVECHLAEDHLAREKLSAGIFEPLWDLYSYPDIELLGIEFDIPKGIVLAKVDKNAELAGLKSGDLITHVEAEKVYTYADLQYEYNKLNRYSKYVRVQVLRGAESLSLKVELPKQWWKSNLAYKHWSVEPILSFSATNLTKEKKEKLGIKSDGFGVKVDAIEIEAMLYNLHNLKKEDVIYSVNGVASSDLTDELVTYVKLLFTAEENIQLGIIREGKKEEVSLKSLSKRFRKVDAEEAYQLPKLSWSNVSIEVGDHKSVQIRTTTSSGYLFIELSSKVDISFQDLHLKIADQEIEIVQGLYRGKTYLVAPLGEEYKAKSSCNLKGRILHTKGQLEIDEELPLLTDHLHIKNGGMLYLLSQLDHEK